ncbi:MAG: flippase [Chloroflexota bacterium]
MPAAVGVATAVLRAILGVAALLLGAGVVGLGIVSVVTSGVNAGVFWWLYARRHGRPGIALDVAAGRQLIRTAAPLMLNGFLNTIFFRIDILLLQAMRGAETVGLYATAYKFIDGLLLVPTFVTLALFPLLSRFADESPERLGRTYRQAVKALVLVAVPIAAGFTFLAEDVLRFFFGDTYAPAAPALRLLVWFLPLSYLNGVTQYLLIAVNRQRLITLAFGLGAAFNILANIAVIPQFGMEGSAVVTVFSEVVLLAPFMAGVRGALGSLPLSFGLMRGLVAAAAMAAALWAIQGAPGPVMVLAGVLVYAAALAALRVLDAEDLRVLRRLIGR